MSETHALIIDDNSKNVNVLSRLLAAEGVSSTDVTDSTQVNGVLAEIGRLDVVFVDLEMPGLDGFDVLQEIKDNPRFAHVPVVAYTVHVSEIHEAHKRGFDGFIGKPIDPDKFTDQWNRILSGQQVWETA